MPKVSEEYTKNKRETLLDAAQRVCNRKCIYDVTMRDIIVESGVSQGGLYCYFKNIDEVFAALLNRFTEHSKLADETNTIFLSPNSVNQTIHKLCVILTDYMIDLVRCYGKYIYELNFLYLHYPERFNLIKSQLKEQAIISNLKDQCLLYLQKQVDLGYIRPSAPLEYLLYYWNATYEGVISTLNVTEKGGGNSIENIIKTMMELMEETIKYQLNIMEEKEND